MALLSRWRHLGTRLLNHHTKCHRPLSMTQSIRCFADNPFPNAAGDTMIRQFAAKTPTFLSLSDIISYTGSTDERRREYGKFIWNELPIRISHRVVELSSLPYNLSNTSSIRELRELYTHSFHLFRMLEKPDSDTAESEFVAQMKAHFESLKSAVPLMAHGLRQCILENPNQAALVQECPFLNGFLDRFNGNRIGTRLLTGQYITCREQRELQRKQNKGGSQRMVGLIDFECDPRAILENAIDDATRLAESNYYGKCPDVEIKVAGDSPIRFAYIPSDLHYIFLELMKNSMRATCESEYQGEPPPIECVIVASQQSDDVTIKISDQGGGIPRESMDKIWYYSFTTVVPDKQPIMDTGGGVGGGAANTHSGPSEGNPMAGFGYGLPLSRLYARYFGGDLEVISMDGFGTDTFVYLNWLKPDDTRKLTSSDVATPIL